MHGMANIGTDTYIGTTMEDPLVVMIGRRALVTGSDSDLQLQLPTQIRTVASNRYPPPPPKHPRFEQRWNTPSLTRHSNVFFFFFFFGWWPCGPDF